MSYLKIAQSNYELRSKLQGQLREIDEAATKEERPYSEDEQVKSDELRSSLQAADDRMGEALKIEARGQAIEDSMGQMLGAITDRDAGTVTDTRSMGERLATDEFRSWAGNGAFGQSPVQNFDGLSFRAVTDVTTGAASGGALQNYERLGRIGNDFLNRKVYLLDLLPTIPVSGTGIEYVQDTSPLADFANKAVEVAEGAAKPQAGPTLSVVTESIATIAAWVNVTRQAAADIPQLMGYLDGRLRYSVKRRADGQAINGNGTSPNLRGLANRTGIVTYAPVAAEARYASIRRGIRLMEDLEAVPEIIVLNPADAELFDLTNATSAGLHATPDQFGGLAAGPARTAWGLTQVHSTAIAAGTALLIDPMAVAVFDRMQPTSYMTDSHASNFVSNILTLLLEARIGLGLFDPSGVCRITFNGAA